MKLHNENVAEYTKNGKKIEIDLCWQGDEPQSDEDRFYDFYDETGNCLNFGTPWHDDGDGIPNELDVFEAFDWHFNPKDEEIK